MSRIALRLSLIIALASLLSACMFAPVIPPRGIFYNNQKAPLFSGKQSGSLTGTASTQTVMMLIGWGDASIETAAANGGITDIRYLDYEFFNLLGVYQRYTTIVHGEKGGSGRLAESPDAGGM